MFIRTAVSGLSRAQLSGVGCAPLRKFSVSRVNDVRLLISDVFLMDSSLLNKHVIYP
jgi:hypothetical protein